MTKPDEIDHQKFTDWRGNIIEIGDMIVFPTMSGRSALLNIGIVRRIYIKKSDDYNPNRLDVEVVDRKWDWRRSAEDKAKRPLSKLKFWNRCLLLEKQGTKREPTNDELADWTEPF
jgi:hypothetical protein